MIFLFLIKMTFPPCFFIDEKEFLKILQKCKIIFKEENSPKNNKKCSKALWSKGKKKDYV